MIKNLVGLGQSTLSDYDIMAKINEAQKKNLNEVDFIDEDGKKVKVLLPSRVNADYMDAG